MVKFESVLPMYQGMASPVAILTTCPVCTDAFVGIKAVLVNVMFHDVVVVSLEIKV
jgi:hypothetical protein